MSYVIRVDCCSSSILKRNKFRIYFMRLDEKKEVDLDYEYEFSWIWDKDREIETPACCVPLLAPSLLCAVIVNKSG